MKSIQVRDLPDHIYYKLKEESQKGHRSLTQQAIATLAQGLRSDLSPKNRRLEVLQNIKSNLPAIKKYEVSNPVDLIRQDRDR